MVAEVATKFVINPKHINLSDKPAVKNRHYFNVVTIDGTVVKNNYDACYAKLYGLLSPFKEAYSAFDHIIQNIVLRDDYINLFEKTIHEICSVFELEYDIVFNEKYDIFSFAIRFGPSPNMGLMRFVLDSIRYSWEKTYDSIFFKKFNEIQHLTGKEYLGEYFSIVYKHQNKYDNSHQTHLCSEYIENYNKDIDLMLENLKKYPNGPMNQILYIFLNKQIKKE